MNEFSLPKREGWILIRALTLYWFNTDPYTIMRELFPEADEGYLGGRVQMYRLGLVNFWGSIDFKHQNGLIELAMLRYGEQAARRHALNEKEASDG